MQKNNDVFVTWAILLNLSKEERKMTKHLYSTLVKEEENLVNLVIYQTYLIFPNLSL